MSVKKFKFVSPGVFINEIDNSQLTKQGDDIGPVIIGTSLRGPSMVPTRIESFSDFVETFGEPLSGSEGADVWREGNRLAPTYAAYAAQAYLRNSSPVTFVRLLGEAHPDATEKAGWNIEDPTGTFGAGADDAAGAYGLFIANGGSGEVKSKGSLEINGANDATLGDAETIVLDNNDGSTVTFTRAEGRHPAFKVTVSGTAAGTDVLELTTSGNTPFIIAVGDAVGDNVATGGSTGATATALAQYVNDELALLSAVADGDDVYIFEDARFTTGAAAGAIGSQAQNLAATVNLSLPVAVGSMNTFNRSAAGFDTTAAYGDETAATAFSLAAACDASGSVSAPDVLSGTSELVDRSLAAQIAALDASPFTLSVDSSDLTKVIVTSGDTGTAGDDDTVTCAAVSIVATNCSGGSLSSLEDQPAALAAIIYAKSGSIGLQGPPANGVGGNVRGVGLWVQSDGANNEFKLHARNVAQSGAEPHPGDKTELISFNFSKNSRLYIRDVLNTNPTLANQNLVEADKKKGYFLGQTFDQHLASVQKAGGVVTQAGEQFACLLPLKSAGDHTSDASRALTPWIISQHNGSPADLDTTDTALLADAGIESKGVEKLMRFHSLYAGMWERKNLKIAIEDIKAPTDKFNPYGTFSVVIRKSEDSDAAPQVVERFSSCNLNPASADYVGKKVGDMRMVWDDEERRYQSHGQYENQSRFVRVQVSDSIESGSADARMLPFGFLGPRRRKDIKVTNGAGADRLSLGGTPGNVILQADNSEFQLVDVGGGVFEKFTTTDRIKIGPATAGGKVDDGDDGSPTAFSAFLKFPSMSLRSTTADSTLSSPRDANFGVSVAEVGTDNTFDESYMDLAGFCGYGVQTDATDPSDVTGDDNELQFIFTLDDIRLPFTQAEGNSAGPGDANGASPEPKNYIWDAGSRASAGSSSTASITAFGGTFTSILDRGVRGFTLPLLGGHDGVDICEIQPFAYHSESNKGGRPGSDSSALDHYALNSLKKAVDTVADPEVVDMNILSAPGATHPSITNHMISVCERRGDALAIIDLDKDYMPIGLDQSKSEEARMPNVDKAISSLRERSINSSYGCAFFPWVQIADTQSGRVLWAPPSLAALGTMASSARKSELWFAPAGFTRGGLTDGAAGLPVSAVRLRLNSKERDKLYEANINPIAQFPAEGIVIFGQKTLQLTPSALDRINVRRLMIFLKKSISRMAKTVLFDQNVESTWSRFTSKADPFLASVQSRFGLSEYKIILDKTTTTTELIDRNIMYAKILLKPTRAIEYIAIDFVITDSGASFDD